MTSTPRYESDRPLHVQVRELIRRQAMSGVLVDETGRLKTEAELVDHFGVSRVTIRSALAPLVESGMFDRSPGRGTFLRDNRSEQWVGHLMGFQETIAEQGYTPGAHILDVGMTNSHDDVVRDTLNERAVWQLRRLRFADATPIAIEHAYYPPDIGLDLEKRDLIEIKLYEVLENEMGFEIKSASQTISARLSTPGEQEALKLGSQCALITMERLTLSTDERPLELLRSIYLPDFFHFSVDLKRRRY